MGYERVAHSDGAYLAAPSAHDRPRASIISRLAPITLSLVSTGLSFVPLGLELADRSYDSNSTLFHVTTQHRSSVQVVVSVLSSILGFLWGYAACGAFNMSLRSWIAKRKVISLDFLRLGVSFSIKVPDVNLPAWLSFVSFLWLAVGLVPAVLWTGALTPDITNVTNVMDNSVPVSQAGYGSDPNILPHINDFIIADHCDGYSLNNGTFHRCPGNVFSGQIVESIRAASPRSDYSPRIHNKLDKSGFNYVGRSYGAGSSVGLFAPPVNSTIDSYSFTEKGYVASVQCTYNDSTAWGVGFPPVPPKDPVKDGGVPSLWTFQGKRPNDWTNPNVTRFFTTAFNNYVDRVIGFSAGGCCGYHNGTPPFYISIATGASYTYLNRTQCQISFQPNVLNVTVVPFNNTIRVTPGANITDTPKPPVQGDFLEWTAINLQTVSMTQTTLYIATMAEAFRDNIQSNTNDTVNLGSTGPPSQVALQAMGDSVTAALDDIIEALNGYHLVKPNGWTYQSASFHLAVAKVGTKGWNIAIAAFNVVAFVLILSVTVYTKLFEASPAFNFADLPSTLAAAACYVANVEDGKAHEKPQSLVEKWRGNPADRVLGETEVEYDCKPGSSKASPPTAVLRSPTTERQG